MRLGDNLYFAPGIRFSELRLDAPQFIDHLQRRVEGYYLTPARPCVAQAHTCAAGCLLLATLDVCPIEDEVTAFRGPGTDASLTFHGKCVTELRALGTSRGGALPGDVDHDNAVRLRG